MTTTAWLDDAEQHAWRSYLELQRRLGRRLARQLQQDSGLSEADFEVLVELSEAPGGRRRSFELCESMQWEKSRLSHHLTRMEKRGLVAREECRTDARGADVVLTRQGRRTIEQAAPLHVAEVRAAFIDPLGADGVAALDRLCAAVLAALEDDEGATADT